MGECSGESGRWPPPGGQVVLVLLNGRGTTWPLEHKGEQRCLLIGTDRRRLESGKLGEGVLVDETERN